MGQQRRHGPAAAKRPHRETGSSRGPAAPHQHVTAAERRRQRLRLDCGGLLIPRLGHGLQVFIGLGSAACQQPSLQLTSRGCDDPPYHPMPPTASRPPHLCQRRVKPALGKRADGAGRVKPADPHPQLPPVLSDLRLGWAAAEAWARALECRAGPPVHACARGRAEQGHPRPSCRRLSCPLPRAPPPGAWPRCRAPPRKSLC